MKRMEAVVVFAVQGTAYAKRQGPYSQPARAIQIWAYKVAGHGVAG